MNVKLAYLGKSQVVGNGVGQTLSLAPNLARNAVAFDAPLRHPLRFREAISALHDVVISDLRFKRRDKTAYKEFKKDEQTRLRNVRQREYERARDEILARRGDVPAELEAKYRMCLKRYWRARLLYASYLFVHDNELWRMLMPCDPIVTVANDVLFFECFSADESSYGCMTLERDGGVGKAVGIQPGTTNVDYSWDLYHHFQALRSYRETRFRIDPCGFEVSTEGHADYREEKIELPPGWLRGFMQIQEAMGLPMRRIELSREAVYSILVWLKRHREKTGPRAIRFDLLPEKPPRIVLEPWEQCIDGHGTVYRGPSSEPIRIWGRRRLLVFARILPLVERFDVYLLGTGLPSFWVAHMGEMRLTVGLSGWTTNDWTRGSALDLIAPPAQPGKELVASLAGRLQAAGSATFAELETGCKRSSADVAAALQHLAHTGQVIHDLAAGVYRWRQVMPHALGEAEIGSPHPELVGSQTIIAKDRVHIDSRQEAPRRAVAIAAKADNVPVEVLIDADGRIRRGKCSCQYYRKFGLRNGPCRHMLAVRQVASAGEAAATAKTVDLWYDRLRRWAAN